MDGVEAGYRIKNGKYAGELITRVPLGYLRWMVNVRHLEATHAQLELDRRGTVKLEIELSCHAIDRASQCALDVWKHTRKESGGTHEGLYTWLERMALQALERGERRGQKVTYQGLRFVFEADNLVWPVLKSVMRDQGYDAEGDMQ